MYFKPDAVSRSSLAGDPHGVLPKPLKRLVHDIHHRSRWQVLLLIYVAGAWFVFEVVQTLTEGLGLPDYGERFAALDTLGEYLSVPGDLSLEFLELDPRFASLREMEEWDELVDRY